MGTGTHQRTRVLVAEDDRDLADVLSYFFEHRGWTPVVARDGRRTVEILRSEPPADLAIIEDTLPHRSGLEIIHDIRIDPGWGRVPIVLLSERRGAEHARRAHTAGADHCVSKPVRPRELVRLMEELLEAAEQA